MRILAAVLLATLAIAVGILVSGAKVQKPVDQNGKIDIYNASTGRVEKVDRIVHTDAEWKKLLTPEQYRVTRQKGTEAAFSSTCTLPPKTTGFYQCADCGTDLFKVDTKFESGTGWPSFWDPISPLNIRTVEDNSFGMHRTEVLCARCGAHLGHVFEDGPPPTGKRYCMNAVALKLRVTKPAIATEKATFAAGCFWGVESAFRELLGKGVVSTRVGYTGGHTDNPTYEQVCSHTTGHAESVEIDYDPARIGYNDLLKTFWSIHDPTAKFASYPDSPSQYRSIIFYHTPEQKKLAEESKTRLEKSGKLHGPIATEILPAPRFYLAEDYHQQYFEKNHMAPVCSAPAK